MGSGPLDIEAMEGRPGRRSRFGGERPQRFGRGARFLVVWERSGFWQFLRFFGGFGGFGLVGLVGFLVFGTSVDQLETRRVVCCFGNAG